MQDPDSPQAGVGEDAAATAGVLWNREVWQGTAQSSDGSASTCSSASCLRDFPAAQLTDHCGAAIKIGAEQKGFELVLHLP